MSSVVDLTSLDRAMSDIAAAPPDRGPVEMIVARPGIGERRSLPLAAFTVEDGLVGDGWRTRGSSRTPDGRAHPDMQVAAISRRLIAAIEGNPKRWSLAGDQLVVDLDLSEANLPPGQRLAAGSVEFEVTSMPHTGCAKFSQRFGVDALAFVSTRDGRRRRLRGVYLRVVRSGSVAVGDVLRKRPGQ